MTKDLARKRKKRLGVHETLNVAAWNVRSIGNKESELVEEIKIKGINVRDRRPPQETMAMREQVKRRIHGGR